LRKKTDYSYYYYIPVKSHIKKFLETKVIINPFRVTIDNEYGSLLFLSLSWKAWITSDEQKLDYNDRMLIEIPKYYHARYGPFISNKKIALFNTVVERMMMNELFTTLDQNCESSNYIINCIFNFRNKYGINDLEMDYQNLRKAYQRHRQKQKELKEFTHVCVPRNIMAQL